MSFDNDEIVIKPGTAGARTKVNGSPLTGERKLEHNDRVLFGNNMLSVLNIDFLKSIQVDYLLNIVVLKYSLSLTERKSTVFIESI